VAAQGRPRSITGQAENELPQAVARAHRGVRLLLAAACCAALPAWAQLPPLPTPGRVIDTLPDRRPVVPPTPPEVVFPAPRPGAKHDPNAPRFMVNAFRFGGNTVFSEPLLKRVVDRFVDFQLNLHELNQAADLVTRYYRERGYPIARAIIPAQKVEQGVVLIELIEGRIGSVSVVGNKRYSTETIEARLAELPRVGVVTVEALERALLLLNDLPGLTARATLQPGSEFGLTDLVIRVEEKWAAGTLALDNKGVPETGRFRLDGALDLQNPLGYGDQLSVRLIESQHNLLTYGRLSYSFPLTASGLRGSATYSGVRYEMGGQFARLGIEGEVDNYEGALSYPWLRSRRRNVFLGLGFRRTESFQTTAFGGITDRDDHINLLSTTFQGSWVHEDSAVSNAYAAFTSNGKHNDSVPPLEARLLRQDAQRAKLEIDMNHLRAASKTWDLYLRGFVGVSAERLADTEKFAFGGPDSVRGYMPSELRGDQGYLGTVELRRQFTLVNVPAVFSVFYDAASAKSKGFAGADSIRSVGVGINAYPHNNLRVRVEYAHGTSDRRSSDGERQNVWLLLSASF
jgi:hemolysin activation/secretion protein